VNFQYPDHRARAVFIVSWKRRYNLNERWHRDTGPPWAASKREIIEAKWAMAAMAENSYVK